MEKLIQENPEIFLPVAMALMIYVFYWLNKE